MAIGQLRRGPICPQNERGLFGFELKYVSPKPELRSVLQELEFKTLEFNRRNPIERAPCETAPETAPSPAVNAKPFPVTPHSRENPFLNYARQGRVQNGVPIRGIDGTRVTPLPEPARRRDGSQKQKEPLSERSCWTKEFHAIAAKIANRKKGLLLNLFVSLAAGSPAQWLDVDLVSFVQELISPKTRLESE
jgi:hypothetical protein